MFLLAVLENNQWKILDTGGHSRHCAQDKFLHFYSWAPICHIDFLSNTISILPHSGVFVVVGNKLENVALLFSSHLSFSSKFAEKPILVVRSIYVCSSTALSPDSILLLSTKRVKSLPIFRISGTVIHFFIYYSSTALTLQCVWAWSYDLPNYCKN